jgi:hypothetical protein
LSVCPICGIVGNMADPNTFSLAYGALSGAATSGLIIYLAKQFFEAAIIKRVTAKIEHDFNEKLETHKDKLKLETDIKIAQASFRYSTVFADTVKVMAETYKHLVQMKSTSENFIYTMGYDEKDQAAKHAEYKKKSQAFFEYFTENKIYFPPEIAKQIFNFALHINAAFEQRGMLRNFAESENIPIPTKIESRKMFEKTMDEIPKLLEDLETAFQDVLGIVDNKKQLVPKA